MSKFDELINSLKKDIRSLPSVDGSRVECMPVAMEDVVVESPALPAISSSHHDDIGADDAPSYSTSSFSKKGKFIRWFVRYGLLSVEFFIFFFILLLITKPSFLYYNERMVHQGRELLRTHFSTMYLISYSIFFTCIFHVLILVHRDLVKRY